MYRIGEFSQLSKTTIKTLRYYGEVGLLNPAFVDAQSGYRYYTTEQLIPLQRIVALRQAGLGVEEVRQIMSGVDAQDTLTRRCGQMHRELQQVQRQLARIDALLKSGKEEFLMKYQAVIKQVPSYTVYYKQGLVPTPTQLEAFILGSAQECLAANPGITCVEPDYCYVSYLDPEYKPENMLVEYGQAVNAAGTQTDTIKFKTLPATEVISVYHQGPYESVGSAFAFALNWAKDNGYRTAGLPRERYIDGKWNQPDPEKRLTEIQIPIQAEAK